MTNRRIVPTDLFRLVTASEPQCTDAGVVYFVRTTFDVEKDEARTEIWRAAQDAQARRVTSGPKDRLPRVARDGRRLAFVAERGEGKRVYTLPLDGGGEAEIFTPAYDAIGALAWSPDGRRLAFTAKAPLDASTASVALDEKSGARHIRRLPFKSDDDGLSDGRRMHLYVVDIAGGEPQRITNGDFDVQSPSWAPDGRRLAFTAKIGQRDASLMTDIFIIGADGGDLHRLTPSNGPASSPVFSRSGDDVAFGQSPYGDTPTGRIDYELMVYRVGDGASGNSVSSTLGRTLGDWVIGDVRGAGADAAPAWSPDDAEIFALVSDAGRCGIRAFRRDGGAHRIVAGGDRDISAFSCADNGAIAFVFSSPTVPSDVILLRQDGTEAALTDLNPWMHQRSVRTPRHVPVRANDGTPLDAWVLDAGEAQAPLVLQVHGGPHFAYGYAFMFEFQVLAAHGIAVAYGNPRGSQSYGTAFADAITGDWGGIDADDVMDILDAALEDGRFDAKRVAIAGGSYGGFMTTWLLGHTKRFACGISMRAVNDLVSEVNASDIGWFLEEELGAPWDDGGQRLFERSPMRAAHHIEAPLLVLHSERDYRCPIDQGEQLFTLLRRLGKTVEFVRFTADGHGLARTGKPRNRVLRLRAITQWLGRFLKPQGWTPAAEAAGALFMELETETPDVQR